MEKELQKYAHYFANLRRDKNKERGDAPHKPVLLLSVIQLIQKNLIEDQRIYITPELVMAFKDNWSKLVFTQHSPNFALPFFHLKSEPFWQLVSKPGLEIAVTSSSSIRSFKNLQANLDYAEIDKPLYNFLVDPVTSAYLEKVLLDTYFETTKANYRSAPQKYQLEIELENEIAAEDVFEYQTKVRQLEKKLDKELFIEDEFVRSGVFKNQVPRIYGYRCAVSKMRLESASSVQMVDACHIVPFGVTHNCHVTNGISLCPNLHRAFDRYLLTINNDYTVRVSPHITEDKTPYTIAQFNQQQILLPENQKLWPALENLEWHREEAKKRGVW